MIEYISIEYFTTGSDYVRKYVRKYIGYGWNDADNDVHVSDADVAEIRKFMAPINERYRL